MNQKRALTALILLASIVISALIIMYYWGADSLYGIAYVPMHIMILVIIYILLQLAKRYVTSTQNWYDWLYYIGLISIALPVFFASTENINMYLKLVQIGTLFLAVPILLEGYKIINASKS